MKCAENIILFYNKCIVGKYVFMLENRIYIKNKKSAGLKKKRDAGNCPAKSFVIGNMVKTVHTAYGAVHSTVKVELFSFLAEEKHVCAECGRISTRCFQHFLRHIHSYYFKAFKRELV